MNRTPYIDNLEPLTLRDDKRPFIEPSRYVSRIETFFKTPSVLIEGNIWRGASSMIERYIYHMDAVPAFRGKFPLKVNSNTTCCMILSWKPTAETIVRYKLWENVGEIVFYPIYKGQAIRSFDHRFQLEVWNTPASVLNADPITIFTTLQLIPDDFCDYEKVFLEWPYKTCKDFIYDLNQFTPADRDYFTNIDCEVTLHENIKFAPYWWLQAIQGSWHMLYLVRSNGMTFSAVTDMMDPPNWPWIGDLINHLPLIDMLSGKVFAIRAYMIDGANGLARPSTIITDEIPMSALAMNALYMPAEGTYDYYGYRLKIGWTDNTYTVRDRTKDQLIVDQYATIPH